MFRLRYDEQWVIECDTVDEVVALLVRLALPPASERVDSAPSPTIPERLEPTGDRWALGDIQNFLVSLKPRHWTFIQLLLETKEPLERTSVDTQNRPVMDR